MSTSITISGNPGATFPGITQFILSSQQPTLGVDGQSAILGNEQDPVFFQLSSETSASGIYATILTFPDLSLIPADATITDARLSIAASDVSNGIPLAPQPITVDMTRLLRPVALPSWSAYSNVEISQYNWTRTPWTTPGGFGAGTDRASTISASGVTVAQPRQPVGQSYISGYFDLGGTQLVADIQAIVAGGSNNGWIVHRRDYSAFDGQWTLCHGNSAAPNIPLLQDFAVGTAKGQTGRRPILTVTYSSAAPAPSSAFLRMSHFSATSEVGSGPYGAMATDLGTTSVANLKMAAGLACRFIVRVDSLTPSGNSSFTLLLDSTDNSATVSSSRSFLSISSGSTNYVSTSVLEVTPAPGHLVQFAKTAGATPTVTCSLSTDNGATWQPVGSAVGSNIDYFIKTVLSGQTGQTTQITFLSQAGLVAV